MSNRKALLIGINGYDFLGELKYARQDAEAIGEALQRYCGFTEDEIILMSCQGHKSRRGLTRYIEHAISALRNYRDLEMLIFGFWGHGFSPSPGLRYLCGMDTNENDLQRTAVSFDLIRSQLAQVQAKNTLLFLDCCQNTPAGRGTADTMTQGEEVVLASMARDIQAAQWAKQENIIPTVAVLNACREGQKAFEWEKRRHGVFTAHLLDAFEQGFDSVAPMAAWTSQRVTQTVYEIYHQKQCPYVTIEGSGDIFLKTISNRKASIASPVRPVPKISVDNSRQQKIRYRDALIAAAADGEISRQEWYDILRLRDELGLAQTIYQEIEKSLWAGTTLEEICREYMVTPKSRPVSIQQPPRPETIIPETISVDCGGGVRLEMKLIPAGEFQMGSPSGEQGRQEDEGPVHQVSISKAFYLGVYEVTQEQYERIMGNNPSYFKGSNRPVENVSWADAMEFCQKLSTKEGRRYTLPTEAQWEYACRAGSRTRYSFGDNAAQLGEYGWYWGNSNSETHPVGQKKPNAWGLYDMHGNVWEWCNDWYDSDYYSISPSNNPTGPTSGQCRVLRGGGWTSSADHCRVAYRLYDRPDFRNYNFGFRVVLDLK